MSRSWLDIEKIGRSTRRFAENTNSPACPNTASRRRAEFGLDRAGPWLARRPRRVLALGLAGLLASARRQCVPGRERVHVVSPMRDFPVFNLDD